MTVRVSISKFLVILLALLSIAVAASLVYQTASSQGANIEVKLESSAAGSIIDSTSYYNVGNDRYLRVVMRVRSADRVSIFRDGNLLMEEGIARTPDWEEVIFDILLSDDQAYEIVIRVHDDVTMTVSENILTTDTITPPATDSDHAANPTTTEAMKQSGFRGAKSQTSLLPPDIIKDPETKKTVHKDKDDRSDVIFYRKYILPGRIDDPIPYIILGLLAISISVLILGLSKKDKTKPEA